MKTGDVKHHGNGWNATAKVSNTISREISELKFRGGKRTSAELVFEFRDLNGGMSSVGCGRDKGTIRVIVMKDGIRFVVEGLLNESIGLDVDVKASEPRRSIDRRSIGTLNAGEGEGDLGRCCGSEELVSTDLKARLLSVLVALLRKVVAWIECRPVERLSRGARLGDVTSSRLFGHPLSRCHKDSGIS